ncbi:MAG: aminoacyl--tRNA ligase-related protein [Candidatus Taylorbacteria bacterium]
MRQSQLFTKTRKEAPKDEVSKNAILLIRAGFINKEMAGVYSFLPLGLRVLNKINAIVRDEMNAIGGVEFFLTSLQDKAVWEKSGRWDDKVVDNWFKTKLKNGTDLGLAFTHEEPLTQLMKEHIRSWRDLPRYPYQIQTKFRNEARAKSGIMRTREFLMKDLYSFSENEKEHEVFYGKAKDAYKKIFERAGVGESTHLTYASGGTFSKFSHEFQTVTLAGEDDIYVCGKCGVAVNEEVVADFNSSCPECKNKDLKKEKAVEVGNIFPLGYKYSETLGLSFIDAEGEKKSVFMGSYGIGPARLMGAVVEVLSDDKGLVWPSAISPFAHHLIPIFDKEEKALNYADKLYENLLDKGVEVLYDDRDMRAGEKFGDADLMGIASQIVVSEKTIAEDSVEVKDRKTGKVEKIKLKEFLSQV